MAVAIGEIYQLTVVGNAAGQAVETVIHFRERSNTSTPAQLKASAEAFVSLMRPLQSSGLLYNHFVLKQMTPVPFDEVVWTSATLDHGLVGNPLANNTLAMVFTKRTGLAGKSHRGRIYIGGLPDNFVAGQVVSAAGIAAATTFAAGVITGFDDATGADPHLAIGLYSRVIGGSSPFTLAGWQAVSRLDLQVILGNQRRRRFGVGI